MSKIGDLLEEINQSIGDLAPTAELAGIEQALSDVVAALEKPREPADLSAVVEAIAGLRLSVQVKPTPVQVHVSPTPVQMTMPEQAVQVIEAPFRPLVLKVNRDERSQLIESIEIHLK